MADDQYRALLTEREREIISGEADVSDNYRYRVVSRIRTKFEELETDVAVLRDGHEELHDELQGIVCKEGDDGE